MSGPNALQKWLVTVATAVLLSFSGWTALTLVQHGAALATQAAKQELIEQWLERIERKLDRVLTR